MAAETDVLGRWSPTPRKDLHELSIPCVELLARVLGKGTRCGDGDKMGMEIIAKGGAWDGEPGHRDQSFSHKTAARASHEESRFQVFCMFLISEP